MLFLFDVIPAWEVADAKTLASDQATTLQSRVKPHRHFSCFHKFFILIILFLYCISFLLSNCFFSNEDLALDSSSRDASVRVAIMISFVAQSGIALEVRAGLVFNSLKTIWISVFSKDTLRKINTKPNDAWWHRLQTAGTTSWLRPWRAGPKRSHAVRHLLGKVVFQCALQAFYRWRKWFEELNRPSQDQEQSAEERP